MVSRSDHLPPQPGAAGAGTGATSDPLERAEVERYARHLLLPEVGLEGQQRLRRAKVLVVGAGGLGSPALLYLAAAGVGTLGVVDDDRVELSNLQRQVIHGEGDLGRPKTLSAQETVATVNPHVRVVRHDLRLGVDNALDLIAGYDVVLDGTDNFPTRYLVNDACVLLGKPHVWGSIYRFDGQVSIWWAGHGPCYRCVFPEPPPPGMVPSCAEGGVLGVLPASIGSIQATEVLKLVLGIGEPLVGRLLVHDALRQTWDTLRVQADPDCPVCGAQPTITELRAEDAACALPGAAPGQEPVPTVDVRELATLLAQGGAEAGALALVDVRGPGERGIVSIPGAVGIPLEDFRSGAALAAVPTDRPVVLACKSGVRSAEAARILLAAGRRDVRSLDGGVLAWVREIDPSLPTY
ncbi:MAG TPA: molybdopterin-synthase adenylyltransferase MoeB [Segeticoccus sp.]|uniref:molybdopterin-synthase adenylyltransferase MoeB n=1 Tax=Segeticoccus sp. TaxID=2706531 RepID=UPI002D7F8142|nr:molybdopterin-synthase adenylyltransferase MoeB [Segeticoccus sp.]HET8599929.1 molybdopterin-synthase adenylyltransferase MoeB [Segeticoccus sp.]